MQAVLEIKRIEDTDGWTKVTWESTESFDEHHPDDRLIFSRFTKGNRMAFFDMVKTGPSATFSLLGKTFKTRIYKTGDEWRVDPEQLREVQSHPTVTSIATIANTTSVLNANKTTVSKPSPMNASSIKDKNSERAKKSYDTKVLKKAAKIIEEVVARDNLNNYRPDIYTKFVTLHQELIKELRGK